MPRKAIKYKLRQWRWENVHLIQKNDWGSKKDSLLEDLVYRCARFHMHDIVQASFAKEDCSLPILQSVVAIPVASPEANKGG